MIIIRFFLHIIGGLCSLIGYISLLGLAALMISLFFVPFETDFQMLAAVGFVGLYGVFSGVLIGIGKLCGYALYGDWDEH
jgi:hypothetical protein